MIICINWYQENSHPENSRQSNSPLVSSPRKIPTQKIPTWKIPTHIFKYSQPRFLVFLFINVTRYHCCWSSLIIGHYYNLTVGSECFYL